MNDIAKARATAEQGLLNLETYKSYQNSPYLSVKHSSYFQVYEELLAKYVGKKITFVEVGVLNGGSLFMWRHYFGPQARIIGVDLNPVARRWQDHGFEIHIGDQSLPRFWDEFFAEVGPVDVLLDDGGHTNRQQVVTVDKCLAHMNDGGRLLVEDVHSSYLRQFGNPSRYSFVNFAKRVIDGINARYPGIRQLSARYDRLVYSVCFYESIVCFNVDRTKCFGSWPTKNSGATLEAEDFRHGTKRRAFLGLFRETLALRLGFVKRSRVFLAVAGMTFDLTNRLTSKVESMRLGKYFR